LSAYTEKWKAVTSLSIISLNAVRFPPSGGCAMSSLRRKPVCGAPPPGVKIDVLSMKVLMGCSASGHIGVAAVVQLWPRKRKYYKEKSIRRVRGTGD
jgi:hypothetical protein